MRSDGGRSIVELNPAETNQQRYWHIESLIVDGLLISKKWWPYWKHQLTVNVIFCMLAAFSGFTSTSRLDFLFFFSFLFFLLFYSDLKEAIALLFGAHGKTKCTLTVARIEMKPAIANWMVTFIGAPRGTEQEEEVLFLLPMKTQSNR